MTIGDYLEQIVATKHVDQTVISAMGSRPLYVCVLTFSDGHSKQFDGYCFIDVMAAAWAYARSFVVADHISDVDLKPLDPNI